MNRSWVSKFAGLVLVLTLITTSLVAGTYAKYVTTVSGSDTVTVAKWKADLEGMGTTSSGAIVFDLTETMSDAGVDGKLLAPGTVGSFALDSDTTGTQVAHNLKITMDASNALTNLTYLKFYSDAGRTTDITTTAAIELMNEDFAATSGGAITTTVYWAWPFSADATQDAADTIDGIAAGTYNVVVNFTATQLDTI